MTTQQLEESTRKVYPYRNYCTVTLNALFVAIISTKCCLVAASGTYTSAVMAAFVWDSLCDLQESVTSQWVSAAPWAGTARPLVCARHCKDDNSCLGFSFPKFPNNINNNASSSNGSTRGLTSHVGAGSKASCFFHRRIKSAQFCTKQEVDFAFYRKPDVCFNGGKRNDFEDRCNCSGTNFMAGKTCADFPKHCKDLFRAGYRSVNTEVYLQPSTDVEKLLAHCIVYPKGYCETPVALNVPARSPDFNRSWHEYESGFRGDGLFWIGLKNLRSVLESTSSSGVVLRVMVHFKDSPSEYQDYMDFRLSDKHSGYKMSYSRVAMKTALSSAACFKTCRGRQFSTYDRDMDENPHGNCAGLSGMGWWFKSCPAACNLLGSLPNHHHNHQQQQQQLKVSGTFQEVSLPGLSAQTVTRIEIKIRHFID